MRSCVGGLWEDEGRTAELEGACGGVCTAAEGVPERNREARGEESTGRLAHDCGVSVMVYVVE